MKSVGEVLISLGCEPTGGLITEVCDAWPVRCQTVPSLPQSITAS